MEVKVVNKSNHRLPEYATIGSAGMDIKANISEPVVLKPLRRELIPTGLYMQIPTGYEVQIRPRSGLACKYCITVVNAPGTIDSDYRGEVKVCLINLSDTPFVVNPGERIAQAVLNKVEKIEWNEVAELDETERGEGGFGHTGK
mgnify:FL=1